MTTTDFPIKNVRTIKALIADAPANFAKMAEAANLPWIEEATEAGTRYVIDFEDLPLADQEHPLVQQLIAIGEERQHDEFWQIWLEAR